MRFSLAALLLLSSSSFVQVKSQEGGSPYCELCGPGMMIGSPENIISIPTQPDQTCGFYEGLSRDGLFDPTNCGLVLPFFTMACGCVEGDAAAGGGAADGEEAETDAPEEVEGEEETEETDAPEVEEETEETDAPEVEKTDTPEVEEEETDAPEVEEEETDAPEETEETDAPEVEEETEETDAPEVEETDAPEVEEEETDTPEVEEEETDAPEVEEEETDAPEGGEGAVGGPAPCNICGPDGSRVTLLDAVVSITTQADRSCLEYQQFGDQGLMDANQCGIVESYIVPICGCSVASTDAQAEPAESPKEEEVVQQEDEEEAEVVEEEDEEVVEEESEEDEDVEVLSEDDDSATASFSLMTMAVSSSALLLCLILA